MHRSHRLHHRALPILALSLALLLGLLLPGLASADADDYGRPGGYIRGGATFTWENAQNLDALRDFFGVTGSTDTFIGGEGALGFRANPYLAFEAEFEYLGTATTKVDIPQTIDAGEIELWDVTGNVRLYAGTGRIQPFVQVGLGYGKADVTWNPAVLANSGGFLENGSDGGFIAKFGGGLDLYVTQSMAIYVDGNYILTTGDVEDNDVGGIGVGAMFRF
jgi:opacity protein-like surface antigen